MSHQYPPTFSEFLRGTYLNGGVVNAVFEERVYQLVGVLSRITDVLTEVGLPYELVGGLAVLAHLQDVAPDEERTTKDVDLMVNRADLDAIIAAATKHGFRLRHSPGVDMLFVGEQDNARDAVHLVFANELNAPNQLFPNPLLAPVLKNIRGREVMVVPIVDLVRMKLTAFRLKDQVHIQSLDRAGLISDEVEGQLPEELGRRLEQVRAAE